MRYVAMCILLLAFGAVPVLHACPLCKEAISTPEPGEEQELNNLPAAYNRSIYMMIGVPYALLGGVGFLIYRGVQKNAEYRRLLQNHGQDEVS